MFLRHTGIAIIDRVAPTHFYGDNKLSPPFSALFVKRRKRTIAYTELSLRLAFGVHRILLTGARDWIFNESFGDR